MTSDFDLYLAAAPPRRRELLEQIGISYRLLSVETDELPQPGETPELYVLRLALAKSRAGRALLADGDQHPVLGADTAVVVDGLILGKPSHKADGLRMLGTLSGRDHHVYTGVALVGSGDRVLSRLSVSEVTFRPMSEQEIADYWASGEPADKAGGYGIQGLAARFIERLDGSYSGVMGLPLFETAELLKEAQRHGEE